MVEFHENHKLRKIFYHFANSERKLNEEQLTQMFAFVCFDPTEKQKNEYKLLFAKKKEIIFSDWISIFKLRKEETTGYTKEDIINAFKLLSEEYEYQNKIKFTKIKSILKEMGLPEEQVIILTKHMVNFVDPNGYIDYRIFVEGCL